MNRDGSEPPDEPVDEGGAPEKDNVIAFPAARVRPVVLAEEAPAEAPAGELGAETPEPRPSGEDSSMTLDAFERAVRTAVREKLGDGADGTPQGADELIAQVFSALTGKDAKTALAEVRQRLTEPLAPSERLGDGDVIDLSAVREARQKASLESAQKIGGALKDTFNQFLATLASRPGASGEITLDAGFFKTHGTSLLGNLFQGLASALMQQARPESPRPPTAPTTPPAEATAAETPGGDASATSPAPPPVETRSVQVKLDLGSILAGLFRRRDTPPPPEPKE